MKPISKTAFYCTGVRALDARKANPACNDQFAERFMDEAAWQAFEPFRKFQGPNISNAARHRIIDDMLRVRLAANPNLRVVIIGAGFDSRAFRLTGGRWLEIDEPQIIAWKEPRLPAAQSPNPLTRVAVDFGAEKLADRLRPFADSEPVAVVIEGVLFYLPESPMRELLQTVKAAYPRGEIFCDVMTKDFFNRYGRPVHEKVRDLGASFVVPERPIDEIFSETGYRETERVSTTSHVAAQSQMPWFMRLATSLLPGFHSGYTIRVYAPR